MKAMILAAGLGTRLMPLTAATPKALTRINGITLLELAIRKLAREGFDDIIVNVHHFAGQVKEFIFNCKFPGIRLTISDESDRLLDTGGAILKARRFLDGNEPFLVHNVDVISETSLRSLLDEHLMRGGMATLSVLERPTRRYFLFDEDMRLKGWTDTSSGEIKWAGQPALNTKQLAFSGIHIISPQIFRLMKEQDRFSIIDTYLDLAGENPIFGSLRKGLAWFDLGRPGQLETAAKYLSDHPELTAEL